MFDLPTEGPPAGTCRRAGATDGRLAPTPPGRATGPGGPGRRTTDPRTVEPDGPAALAALAERVRPTSWRGDRLLAVPPPLAPLVAGGGLRRGSTLTVVSGHPGTGAVPPGRGAPARGEVALTLALVASATGRGAWCAAVGVEDVGAEAAGELGVAVDRLVLVPRPGSAWGDVAAALLDGTELVVVHPPFPPRPAVARRLVARARERQTVLVVLPGDAGWPEPPDLTLAVEEARWEGAGQGDGRLLRRHAVVVAAGRRGSSRPRRRALWLPGPEGTLEDAGPVRPDGPGGGGSRGPVGPDGEQWGAGAP